MQVTAIKNGTVIDHILAGQAFNIIKILSLHNCQKVVTVGLNFPSKQLGRKDFIKIEDWKISPEEAKEVALFAPCATINIIGNYTLEKKFSVKIPEQISHLIVCPSPRCITHHEKMESCFYVRMDGQKPKFQCKYCEKIFSQEQIQEYQI